MLFSHYLSDIVKLTMGYEKSSQLTLTFVKLILQQGPFDLNLCISDITKYRNIYRKV